MLLIRFILLYCVFIINGMCSDVNFDQFKSEFESMKTHIVSMESRIELLKIDADQCKIKTEALTEELRIHKDEINTKITEAEAKLETLDSLDAKFQEYVELSSLMTVAESCLELASHGITTSKEYDLDPDGINRGQIPIKAHCSLPDGVTKIGHEIEIEVLHCDTQSCFTHVMNYDSVTIEQIIALMQSSTECYQKIEFHCLSTPLVASVTDEKMFSLKDRNGTEYWPESLGNSSCNHIYPQWMKDVEYIRDMNVLPVTGFSYGPMKFEAQEAKVKLGPLTCHPDENSIFKNSELEEIKKVVNGCLIKTCLNKGSCMGIENDFKCSCPPGFTGKRCETNIDECINNPCINGECKDEINGYKCQCHSGFSGQNCDITCPIEDSKYKVVDDQCYYFINTYGYYEPQKKICKTLFSGNGRLFEPQNSGDLKKVHKFAKDNFNRGHWYVGIQDPYQNGTLTFTSSGLPLPFTVPTASAVYEEKCVLVYPSGNVRRFTCSRSSQRAICENAS